MADKVYLHLLFQKHKTFLHKLYSVQNASKTLNSASDEQIDVVLKILHLVGDAQIHVSEKFRDRLLNSKRSHKLTQLGSRTVFKQLMRKNRSEKLRTVKDFASLLPALLHLILHLKND